MFKGILPVEQAPVPQEAARAFHEIHLPALTSWRTIVNPFSHYVWQTKPPGAWVVLLRLDEYLLTSSDQVPLDVDYAHIYEMLTAHKSALLCRLDDAVGLIGIAVRQAHFDFVPWLPGVAADEATLESLDMEKIKEYCDGPEGLQLPSIINIEPADPLQNPITRRDWLKTCPTGLWLMSLKGEPAIYEVVS